MADLVKNNTYSIACGIDNNYVEHLVTMLNSLFLNNTSLIFHIYVLSFDLSKENKGNIASWVTKNANEITFIDVKKDLFQNFPIFDEGYISPATYLRLFIPSLLPQHIDKVLYLDSDIIVNTNIDELLNTDISTNTLAAVEDAPNNSVILQDKKQLYFNAGVLLLNLRELRKSDFLNDAVNFIQKNHAELFFHDQDVLNALLGNHAKIVPIKWNMLDCFYSKPPKILPKYLQDYKSTDKKNCIIHFSGKIKPWHIASLHPLTNFYFKYKPKINIEKLKKNDKWQHFDELPRYQKLFIHLHLPRWMQRILDRQICWIWRKLKI